MKPGHGEVLLAEGDPLMREDEERLARAQVPLEVGRLPALPARLGDQAGDFAEDIRQRRERGKLLAPPVDLTVADRRAIAGVIDTYRAELGREFGEGRRPP